MNTLRSSAPLLVIAFALAPAVADAAAKFETQILEPKAVPAAVQSAHAKRYAKVKTSWRKNAWSNDKGVRTTVYVGWFFHEKKAHRAAYTEDGKGYLTIRYLGGAAGLPPAVKKAVEAAHPKLKITAAQRYEAFTLNMTAYRVELRQGSTKLVTWVDGEGQPISKDNLPDAIEELGT